MAREIRQQRLALRDAARVVDFSHHPLRARLMGIGVEHEGAGCAQLAQPARIGPARDDVRQRRHVVLRITAADAERMQFQDFAGEIFVQSAVAVFPGARIRAQRLLVVEKEQHRRMLLDRLQHVGETPEHVRPDRLALERTGPHSRWSALVGGDAEMIGPEHHQPLGKSAIGDDGALQPRQRFGAKGFLDDVERCRWRFWRIGPHCLGRRHGRIAIVRRLRRRFLGRFLGKFLGRHVHGDAVKRKVPPLRFRIRRRLTLGRGRRRLGGCVAGLLNLELIVEHGLAERLRRLQSRHFEQHAIGTDKFCLDEAARIGGGIEKIARRAAARAQSEAIERNERCLRIAGHRISLGISQAYSRREV